MQSALFEEWVSDFVEEAVEQAEQKTEQKVKEEIATKLLRRGDPQETVAEIVNFPAEKIKKIADDIKE